MQLEIKKDNINFPASNLTIRFLTTGIHFSLLYLVFTIIIKRIKLIS